jgi:deoxyuridine 5'-triphosphate nucleotidohydrolase
MGLSINCITLLGGRLPQINEEDDAAHDCYAREGGHINYLGYAKIPLGFKIEIPVGKEGQIRGRSGLASIGVFGHLGTIDAGYRGEVGAILYCLNPAGFSWDAGFRVAQLAIRDIVKIVEYQDVELLSPSSRGEKGFGSSGVSRDLKKESV